MIVCLLALFAQLSLAVPRLSATYDEPIYTGVGYADLITGDFYWHRVIGHGPLINVISALPLLLDSAHVDVTQLASWGSDNSLDFGREVLAALGPLKRTLFVTRYPVVLLTLLLAAVVFRWASRAAGQEGGLFGLLLFCFEPNIIAHGQLNTTDMGVTAFGFVGVYLLSRYLSDGKLRHYVGTGIALGAAVASKTSGFFWIGAYALILLAYWLSRCMRRRVLLLGAALKWALRFAGLLGISIVALWAFYGFEWGPISANGVPIPAPSHWAGLAYQRTNLTEGQRTFIAGDLYLGGHWSYFPLTLMLKTPLPLLLVVIVGTAVWLRRGRARSWPLIPLALPPFAYLAVSMIVNLNIGHRHLLPVLPFLVVLASQAANPILARIRTGRGRGVRILAAGWVGWYVLGTVSVFPHYLAFFNRLAGGPDGGYRYLADSSIDWGQGFYDLERYLGERQSEADRVDPVYLAAFSSINPVWYDLDFEPIPPTESAAVQLPSRFRPSPGLYVISAVPLQGIWTLDPDTYDWFRHKDPTARVAHVFHVYEVPPRSDPIDRVIQCADPLPPLTPEALEEGFGASFDDATILSAFNCAESWLYPRSAGWLALPGYGQRTPWTERRLDGLSVIFEQREHWSHPEVTLYRLPPRPEPSRPPEQEIYLAPSGWSPSKIIEANAPVNGPIQTSGPLVFLGYERHVSGSEVRLATFWRVEDLTHRPLSLMAHSVDSDGLSTAVADGLGVSIDTWRPGDVIVQSHRFVMPESGDDTHYFRVGAYWLDTMERWSLGESPSLAVDSLLLPPSDR